MGSSRSRPTVRWDMKEYDGMNQGRLGGESGRWLLLDHLVLQRQQRKASRSGESMAKLRSVNRISPRRCRRQYNSMAKGT